MTVKGKCQVVVTRPQGRKGTDVCIQVTDELSHVQFVEIYMDHEQFSVALGSSIGIGEFELRGVDVVGMTAENKTEVVPFKCGDDPAEALAPFEVDGWKGRSGDLGNMHRHVGNGYRVVFFRHVPTESEEA